MLQRWGGIAMLLIVAVALIRAALPGLYSARPLPPSIEIAVATWLLRASVPAELAARADPLAPTEADIAAGAALFQQHCATCHAWDGSGQTQIGTHAYPRVPSLRSETVTTLRDGQIFAYIRDGIRNTAMPAWDLPERQIWQLVLFIRHMPPVGALQPQAAGSVAGAHYVGSAACQSCHRDIYDHWQK